MSSWDDVEVDSDGDELLDWLWDIPERYNVGDEEEFDGGTPWGPAGIRKRVRRPGEAGAPPGAAWATVGPLAQAPVVHDRPTEAIDPFEDFVDDATIVDSTGFDDGGGDRRYDTAPVAAVRDFAGRPARRHVSGRDLATVAAVIFVIAAGAVVGYTVFGARSPGKASKLSNLAVGTPTTVEVPTTVDPGVTPAPGDTTTSIPPTTATTPSSSVPAAIVAATTSTTIRRCAVKLAAILPAVSSDTTIATATTTTTATTATTVPATTTTAATTTTVPPTTTTPTPPPTTAPPTTKPPTTAPPTTRACH